MSSVNERFRRVLEIHLDHARQKALKGQVLYVKDGEKKEFEFVNVEDLPYGESTVGQVIHNLQVQNEYFVEAFNLLVETVNENQEATTKAIGDIREELEKGKVL